MPDVRPSITPDVIVVGAGTAGCVVAAELANAGVDVELIEAGGPPDGGAASRSPDWLEIQADPARRWGGLEVDRDGSGSAPYLIGRGVGGGSAINGMVLSPSPVQTSGPVPSGGTVWANDPVWDVPGFADAMSELSATWGTVTAGPGPLGEALMHGARSRGWVASPVPLGLDVSPNGDVERRSVSACLGSLAVVTDTTVRRCTLSTSGTRVTGVELADGTKRTAGHVIVCAGAIHTPAMLLRSGIDNGAIGRGVADHPSRVFTVPLGPELESPPGDHPPITTVLRDGGIDVLVMDHTGPTTEGRRHGAVIVMLMNPTSTGSIGLDGDSVRVELGLLSDGTDRDRLDTAADRTAALLDEVLGGESGDRPIGERQPGFGPVSHVAASCRHGSAVGDAGEVLGFVGVSVMDSSAFPRLPAAHPMLPTMALATAFSAEWLRRSGFGHHPSP